MKKSISIIGGGAAALAFAAHIDTDKFDVLLFEKNKALARKFLVAGDGGFNLTHGSPIEDMTNQYQPLKFLDGALHGFTNNDFRYWLNAIGIETFVGSSGRVFPVKPTKPIEVLQAILKVLTNKGICIKPGKQWTGWNPDTSLQLNGSESVHSDIVVYALGGSSWKVTGSDGTWLDLFKSKNIKTNPFRASNCAFEIQWPEEFLKQHAGKALKNIQVKLGEKICKGELSITSFGLEGNAIYPLSSELQANIKSKGYANFYIDFKPMFSEYDVLNKLALSKAKNTKEKLKKDLALNDTAIQILKNNLSKEDYLNDQLLAKAMKHFPLKTTTAAPIDEAISTTGGIALDAVDENFQLKQMPNHYCIGEMLDWNAPTGGYLLQGCFSMGVKLARHLNAQES